MCRCSVCLHLIPVFLTIIITLWSYYVYVVEFCSPFVTQFIKKLAYAVVFHIFFLMMSVTYVMVLMSRHEKVPPWYNIPISIYDRIRIAGSPEMVNNILVRFCSEYNIYVYTRESRGYIRYCLYCRLIKPDRTHHCSTCNICVLKMDHHCPWVDNCIGYSNYKQFVILIMYSSLYCTFYTATIFEEAIKILGNFGSLNNNKIQIVVSFFISLIFAVTLWLLFWYHITIMKKNETSIEASRPTVFENHEDNNFDLGDKNNFYEVCGTNCCLWWLPVTTNLNDGLNFEINRNVTLNAIDY